MASIKFDGTELVNSTYIPRYARHESAPLRDLSVLELAREDGAILVSERYGMKIITIKGKLTAATQSALETAIDSFKLLFSGVGKNLDIEWEGSTRRYVATCRKHIFNRDFFHLLFVPWSAEFIVPSGIGEPTSETHLVNNQSFAAVSYSSSMTFLGSAKPKPRFRLKCGVAATDPKGFSFENTDKSERMIVSRTAGFGANKYFEIDCRKKTVKYDGSEIPFYGVFPTFDVGANNYEIVVGDVPDQQFIETENIETGIYGHNDNAQSFSIAYKDVNYQGIELHLKKTGNPVNDLWIEIQTDNNGAPSGSAVANATFQIPIGNVGGSWDWEKINTSGGNTFTLEPNTRYWIVASVLGNNGDINNYYGWSHKSAVNATYKRGEAMTSPDSGANWSLFSPTRDLNFKSLYCGKADAAKTYYFDVYYFKRFL